MASITLDAVLEHIHRLPLDDQSRLTNILHREQNQRVINAATSLIAERIHVRETEPGYIELSGTIDDLTDEICC